MAEVVDIYRPTAWGHPVANQSEVEYFQSLDLGEKDSAAPDVDTSRVLDHFARTQDKGKKIVRQAQWHYDQLLAARLKATRNRKFTTGDQWSDPMKLDDGRTVKEEEYIRSTNRIPIPFNQIDALIKNLLGQLRQNTSDRQVFPKTRVDPAAAEQMSLKLRDAQDLNSTDELDVDQFREMLMAGVPIYKISASFDNTHERWVPMVEAVDLNRFFFNHKLQDPYRFRDLEIIGDIRDYRIEQVMNEFGGSDQARRRAIFDHYRAWTGTMGVSSFDDYNNSYETGIQDNGDQFDFMQPLQGRARVIEVWRREWRDIFFVQDRQLGEVYQTSMSPKSIDQHNRERMMQGLMPVSLIKGKSRMLWVVYYLSPDGWILRESVSPYTHEQHPYVLGFAEYIEGSWSALVDRLIDIQKFTNRLYSAIDFMMGVGAKGLLLVAEEHLGGKTPEEFAEDWREFGGVIVYKPRMGVPPPTQITAQSVSAEWFSMLTMVKREMQDLSGVSNAIQGRTPTSGTPAERYQAEIVQSSLNNLNFFHRFFHIVRERDRKLLQVMLQVSVNTEAMVGSNGRDMIEFNPAAVRDIEWDVALADIQQSAAYRLMHEDILMQLLSGQQISFDEWLQVTANPVADKIKAVRQMTQAMQMDLPTAGMGQIGQALQSQPPTTGNLDDMVKQLQALAA